jgi:hypothetical protein
MLAFDAKRVALEDTPELRLAEFLAGLSLVTDLVLAKPHYGFSFHNVCPT